MKPILIVGASGRAAAASAIRAGLAPTVIDLFADVDTQGLCPVLRCRFQDYPHGFIALANQAPPGPWMYTGGLENHPEIVTAISSKRELWGNPASVLETIRDPYHLARLSAERGWNLPQILHASLQPPGDRCWLRKPLRGSAGFGIRLASANDPASAEHYYQEFLSGESMSAIFCGERCLGVTRQFTGTSWLNAGAFRYAGNIGPVDTESLDLKNVLKMGTELANLPGVRGLFGLDFILTANGGRVIEVNPRYPASVEVLEHSHGFSSLSWHRQAFESSAKIPAGLQPGKQVTGKVIYYAPKRIEIPERCLWNEFPSAGTDPVTSISFCDIPPTGTIIDAGQPVVTILAIHKHFESCEGMLKLMAKRLDNAFGFPGGVES